MTEKQMIHANNVHAPSMNTDVINQVKELIPDAEPLDDPLNIAPHVRSRYFRENIYPYAERMRSKEYYEHKLPLQIELVKLQNWIKDSGERLSSLKDEMPRARAARLRASWSIGIPGPPA